MSIGTVRIQGADATVTNTSGANFVPSLQVTTAPSFLNKLVVFVAPAAVDMYIWIFDTAAGAAGTADPVVILTCPAGFTTTLDFGDYGKLFTSGIYLGAATDAPADATDTRTAAANNEVRMAVDYKVK